MRPYQSILLTILASSFLGGTTAHSGATDTLMTVALREHNAIRSAVGVGPLAWDSNLAKFAQARAASLSRSCGLKHSTAAARSKIPGWPGVYVGENLAYGANSVWVKGQLGSTETAIAESVKGWGQEKINYKYANNTCAPGQVCGHYTQVVWRTTNKVGCGFTWCSGTLPQAILVCAYGPGGNTSPSQKPY